MIRRLLLCLPLLGLAYGVVSTSAQAAIITVNTLADEDGENSSACSLREAIRASQSKQPYGGCPAGQQYYTDTIQLAAGTYKLNRGELVVAGAMQFNGAAFFAYYDPDAITGQPYKRLPVTTTIENVNGGRIFNTSVTHSDLNLNAINLIGGNANRGGAILAGGTVELSRVNISGAKASEAGGAVFLEGDLATLTATASTFQYNNAPVGSVLGMSCYDNLKYTTRTIGLTQLSITYNGSSQSASTLDFCGSATVSMVSSTVAKNTTLAGTDAVGDAAAIRMIDNNVVSRLSTASSLKFVSNTVTENTTPYGLLYGNMASMAVDNNILAYNSALDCSYQRDGAVDAQGNPLRTVVGHNNLFATTSNPGLQSKSKCVLYDTTNNDDITKNGDTNVYASNTQILTNFVSPIGFYGDNDPDYYGYLPLAGQGLIGKGATTDICGSTDQRGLNRGSSQPLRITADGLATRNTPCDIGAMDLSKLQANDDQGGGNTSYVTFTNTVTDTTGLSAADAAKLTQLDADYHKAYKDTYRYREAVIEVTKNDFAAEVVSGSGSTIPFLAPPKGIATPYTVTGSDVGNIHCEWNATMKALLASRKDGTVTPGGQRDKCDYTISDGVSTVHATAWFTISNIAPIAIDHNYTLPFGAPSIDLDLLAGASDDGDGPMTSTGYPQGKLPFYQDSRVVNGQTVNIPTNIILVTKPTQGHIVAEFQGPCVTNNANTTTNTCYGGKLTYVNDNLFSPFNDSFTYEVIDSDFAPSNSAKVTITNTATTTDKAKSGGGSLGLCGLLGLVSLALIRRRATMAKSS